MEKMWTGSVEHEKIRERFSWWTLLSRNYIINFGLNNIGAKGFFWEETGRLVGLRGVYLVKMLKIAMKPNIFCHEHSAWCRFL